MDLMYVCPECGSTSVGDSEWKEWCTKHELTVTKTDDGLLYQRKLVEMKPQESVPT